MTDYQIWPATDGPASATVDGGVVLATEFYVTSTGMHAKAIRFWRADTSILGPITGRIYQVTDASSGTAVPGTDVTFTLSGTGWQIATLASPVALTQNQRYRVCCQFGTNYSATGGYWSSGPGAAGITNGPLTAPDAPHATGGDQGSFAVSGTLTYPAAAFNSTAYWVDVTVTDTSGQTVAVGLATETGTAQATGKAKARTLGLPTETAIAQATAKRKLRTVALAVEASEALALTTTTPPGRLAASARAAGGLTASARRIGGPA